MNPSSRHEEGVLLVTQRNDERGLYIVGANASLRELLGHKGLEEDMPLCDVLAGRSRRLVEDNVEFERDERDLHDVLSVVPQLRLLTSSGSEVTLDCRISRMVARDRHHLFRIVLSRPNAKNARQSLAQQLKQQFLRNEEQDPQTGLVSIESMRRHLKLASEFVQGKEIDACFVYLRLEGCDPVIRYGGIDMHGLLAHVGAVIRRNLRSDDTVGRIAEDALGAILVDINRETVFMALNRIVGMVRHDPLMIEGYGAFVPHVRQSCVLLDQPSGSDILEMCVHLLDQDETRDMVMFRGVTQELGMFGHMA